MDYKHCIKNGEQIRSILSTIESSTICDGLLEDDDLNSVAIDPNSNMDVPIPRTCSHSSFHSPCSITNTI